MAFRLANIRARAGALIAHRRTRRIALWAAMLVIAFGIVGGLISPPLVRYKLASELSKTLQRDVSIQQVRINPYSLSIWIRGLLVDEPQNSATAISFDELYLNLQLESLFRRGLVFKEIRLLNPYVSIVRNEDLTYNFTDVIHQFSQPRPERQSSGAPPRFSLNNIELIDGRIDFDDRVQGTQHSVTQIRIGVPFISSLPSYVDIKVEPAFSALIDGAPLEIGGETKPFKDSRESTVHLQIDGLDIPKYAPYSPVELKVNIPSGELNGKISASFRTAQDRPGEFAISGHLEVTDLALEEPNDTPVLKVPALHVGVDAFDVFASRARLSSIRVERPEIRVRRNRDGSLNLAQLVAFEKQPKELQAAKQEGRRFEYAIEEILVEQGKLRFDDLTVPQPFQKQLENIRIAVKGLTTEAGKAAETEVSFQSDLKEQFSHHGTIQFTPFLLDGKFAAQDIRLGALRPYYESVLNARINDGRLDLASRVTLGEGGKQAAATLSELNATVRSLRVDLPGQSEPLWRIPLLALKTAMVDFAKKTVVIGSLEARDGTGFVHRNSDGSLSYAKLLKPQAGQEKTTSKPQQEEAWRVDAKQLLLDRVRVVFEDRALPVPQRITVSDLTARASDVSNAKKQPAKAMLRARINNKGLLSLSGAASTNPVTGAFDVQAQGFDLLAFQPYFQDRVNFTLTGGEMGTNGRIDFDASAAGPVKMSYQGSLQITDFAAIEQNTSQDLINWKSLALDGIRFSHAPMDLRIDEVTLAHFNSRIVIAADGKINLQQLAAADPEKQQEPSDTEAAQQQPAERNAQAAPAQERRVTIGKLNLENGEVRFSDFFIKPNYSAHLTSVQGVISELTPETPGNISLNARLDGAAPVGISGRINPLSKDLYLDIQARAKEIEMRPFSPYSGKYVGYGIESGKLSLDVKYRVASRKLSAENQITLNQLTFGERIESPQATRLPVQLAVALLKDRNGVIDLNVPIGGSLDDPQFSVGGIIWRLVTNIITNAVTAPFALLGAAFGGGGQELSYIEFSHGRERLTETAEAKLKTLSSAMANRPGLKLEISGRVDPVNDLEGLRKLSVERKVKAQKLKQLRRQGKAPRSVDEIELAKDEYERFLRAAYDEETFPKPRNFIGLPKALPMPEMEELMLKHTIVTQDDLRDLANRRALAVRDRLLGAGVDGQRLLVLAQDPRSDEEKIQGSASRVDLNLR